MEELKARLKDADDAEERAGVYGNMRKLVASHYSRLENILGEDASELVEARKAVYEENELLRNENRASREALREDRKEIVEKYRGAFIKKLGNSLDKIPAEKLPQIVERINTMMAKEGTNETMMAALTAILELVEEKMEGDDVESDVLDTVESLLQ